MSPHLNSFGARAELQAGGGGGRFRVSGIVGGVRHIVDPIVDIASDKGADIKDAASDIIDHPGATPEILYGTRTALFSFGDRRREGNVTIYENCWGACSPRLWIPGTYAYTTGHTIFGDAEVSGAVLDHERVHVRDQDRVPLFPLKYAADSIRERTLNNSYEREAQCAARQRSRLLKP